MSARFANLADQRDRRPKHAMLSVRSLGAAASVVGVWLDFTGVRERWPAALPARGGGDWRRAHCRVHLLQVPLPASILFG
jgi:hypothetical protein